MKVGIETAADRTTTLIRSIFRINGRLLHAGDRLVAPLGLTSARWQVLGEIVDIHRPKPVVAIARDMGVSRQNVQRIVNDLVAQGLVVLTTNPLHKRAHFVTMTNNGRDAYARAIVVQRPWVATLARGVDEAQIDGALSLLGILLDRLAADDSQSGDP
jgi:DNA-binding MarR family transcriptional regulator